MDIVERNTSEQQEQFARAYATFITVVEAEFPKNLGASLTPDVACNIAYAVKVGIDAANHAAAAHDAALNAEVTA